MLDMAAKAEFDQAIDNGQKTYRLHLYVICINRSTIYMLWNQDDEIAGAAALPAYWKRCLDFICRTDRACSTFGNAPAAYLSAEEF